MSEKEKRQGYTLWLTGLSNAGKTTLGIILKSYLESKGIKVEHIDGNVVRENLCRDLGFSPQDRIKNIERVCLLTQILNRNGIWVIASLITPYNTMRHFCRQNLENYVEIYVKCSLDVAIKRDRKGLYSKALAGEIENFTGISDLFEEPDCPDIVVVTEQKTPEECLQTIVNWLERKIILSG
ncbi:MAG: adenylyl-sulfate kinase [Bacillota bacterium]